MLSIRYTKRAVADLENIYLIIAQDKKSVAASFVNKIDAYILLLKTNPKMGKDCRQKGYDRDCRVLFYDSYAIFYKIYKNHISVQRIINTKQNYKG
jgi:plasmid stabilization system protein ParE